MLFFKKKKYKIKKDLNGEKVEIDQKEELYKGKSFKAESIRPIVIALISFVSIIFIIFIISVLNLCISAYSVNIWLGYIAIIISIAITLFIIVFPIIKIAKKMSFILEHNQDNYRKVKKHNDKVIKSIAKNIIDFSDSIRNNDYYDSTHVNELRNSLNKNDMVAIRNDVRNIMNTSVKKKSNDIIVKYAKQVGVLSAISQSGTIDGIVIIILNIKLIYDLIFLYGFRYSFAKLVKSSITILIAVAAASGLQSVKIGKRAVEVMIKALPFMSIEPLTYLTSSVLGIVIDLGVQGFGNAAMTAIVGYKTIGYLAEEYKLQDELNNGIERLEILGDEKELKETLKQVKVEVEKENKESASKK